MTMFRNVRVTSKLKGLGLGIWNANKRLLSDNFIFLRACPGKKFLRNVLGKYE